MNQGQKRFNLGKGPFIRKADGNSEHTSRFMLDLLIALIPLVLFAWVKNGLMPFLDDKTNFWGMIYPLLLPVLGAAFSYGIELFWWGLVVKKRPLMQTMRLSYAIIPGLLLGMIVSVSTPIWVLFIGVLFAVVIGKLIFGGFGHNIFNPALIGFVFLTTYSYFGLMGGASSFGSVGFLNPSEFGNAVAGATPLGAVKSGAFPNMFAGFNAVLEEYGLLNMFLGFKPGALAETSGLLILLAFVYLTIRKVIDWRIPVIFVGTVFGLSYLVGAINGYAGTLDFALFHVLSGGLLFGAVFMATEPVTSPRNPNGKIIYALGMGILTVIFRFASKNPEGVAVSILTMNMLTAIIEKLAAKLRVEPKKGKVAISYSIIGLLLLGLASFPVIANAPVGLEYVGAEQDLYTLNLNYTFSQKGEEFVIVTDIDGNILDEYANEYADIIDQLQEHINENQIMDFVLSVNEGISTLTLVVQTDGYGANPPIYTTYIFDTNNNLIAVSIDYQESYPHNPGWDEGNGHPNQILPDELIENFDDLDSLSDFVVVGASVTSKAILRGVTLAQKYLDHLDSIDKLVFMGATQDFDTLEFAYIFRDENGKFVVNTDHEFNITTSINEAVRSFVEEVIDNNKIVEYILSATDTEVVVITDGYGANPPIKTTFTLDAAGEVIDVEIEYDESYTSTYNGLYNSANGHPSEKLPTEIIDKFDELDSIDEKIVAGATVTTKAIIRAAKIMQSYIAYLSELRFIGLSQDYDSLDFVYEFSDQNGSFTVKTNHDYEITSTINEDYREFIENVISNNKLVEYVKSATATEVVIITDGYGTNPLIKTIFTINSENEVIDVVIEYSESYTNAYNALYNSANGHPSEKLPTEIIDKFDELDSIDEKIVAGATVTTKAIIRAAKIMYEYLESK